MTTASIQDLDSFIQLQKEKLIRDRGGSGGYLPQQPTNYNRQIPVDTYQTQPQQNQFQQAAPFQDPRSTSPAFMYQQQLSNEKENFFERFGSYEQKKNKLRNDLSQEYNQYLNQKRNEAANTRRDMPVSSDFYATLPLKGMERSYSMPQRSFSPVSLEPNTPGKLINWWKNYNEPDIKPYSKHSGSQENLPSQLGHKDNSKSKSYYDVSAAYQAVAPPPAPLDLNQIDSQVAHNAQMETLRQLSASAMRRPILHHSSSTASLPLPAVDPALTDILRRPPVGMKTSPHQRLQSDLVMRMIQQQASMNQQQQMAPQQYAPPPQQQRMSPVFGGSSSAGAYQERPRNMMQPIPTGPNTTQNSPKNPAAGFAFSEDQNRDLKALKVREYQEDLERQMREKQAQKQREKEEQERLDRKMLVETEAYNPFGRGGGGAPLKDRDGNIIANLAQAKAVVNAGYEQRSPRSFSQQPTQQMTPLAELLSSKRRGSAEAFAATGALGANTGYDSNKNLSSNSNDEPSFARGGGLQAIWGDGKTDEQKRQEDRYKAELARQIEEKARAKAMEKEKEKQEDEKWQKRWEEDQRKLKAEMEEEERKKREKEEKSDMEKKRLEEIHRQEKLNRNKPGAASSTAAAARRRQNTQQQQDEDAGGNDLPPPPVADQHRSTSPPVPALKKNSTAKKSFSNQPPPRASTQRRPTDYSAVDFYTTESRLNVSSPNQKNDVMPRKPMLRKIASRPASQVSNSELITQLQNLKKHLHSEQIEVENQLYNSNNRTTVGQLSDIHHNILNVKTPPSDATSRRFDNGGQRTYRKDSNLDTPPLNGGYEPRTYYRDNSGSLKNDNLFSNDLQREANQRANKLSLLNLRGDYQPTSSTYDIDDQLTQRNQQRLKKLRDNQGDNVSINDPNEVLDKFVKKSEHRPPSTTTVHDDTWLRQPA